MPGRGRRPDGIRGLRNEAKNPGILMKKLLLILVVLGLLTAGVAYWISSNNNGSENGYSYEGVKYDSLSEVVNATGIVIPRDIALVFCKVPGTVEEIYPYARVGQKVEK